MVDDGSYTTAPRGFENTTLIDLPSLKSRLEIGAATTQSFRRKRLKNDMNKSRNIDPLQTKYHKYIKRDWLWVLDKTPSEGLIVRIVRSLFCSSQSSGH